MSAHRKCKATRFLQARGHKSGIYSHLHSRQSLYTPHAHRRKAVLSPRKVDPIFVVVPVPEETPRGSHGPPVVGSCGVVWVCDGRGRYIKENNWNRVCEWALICRYFVCLIAGDVWGVSGMGRSRFLGVVYFGWFVILWKVRREKITLFLCSCK